MLRKMQNASGIQKHLSCALLAALCMLAVTGITSVCFHLFRHLLLCCTMIFFLSVILISCNTLDPLCAISCAVFSALWLELKVIYPSLCVPASLRNALADALCAASVMTLISLFILRLAKRAALTSVTEKQLETTEIEKTRANLLRAIPHDLRTPLTGIIGNSLTYLENQDTLTDDEKTEIVRNIYESSAWLGQMVENLLTVTRVSKEELSLNTRAEYVDEVAAEALQKVEKAHRDCIIRASVPERPVMIPMDPILIEQVIINLLENALLHSGVNLPIDFIVLEHPGSVSFTVRDYGNGIPERMQAHLFDGTAHSQSGPSKSKGMGIGLMICQTIVTAHHGTITGRSLTDGAEFTFTLPKGKEEDHES